MVERRERYGFRFLRLSDEKATQFHSLHRQDGLTIQARHDGAGMVARVPLEEGKDYAWLKVLVNKENIASADFGFFLSIRTDETSGIMRVPDFVVQLIQELGGVVDFSFTFA